MSIWEYKGLGTQIDSAVFGKSDCVFCNTRMSPLSVRYAEFDEYNVEDETQIASCPTCGWWKLIRVEQEITATQEFCSDPDDLFDDGVYRGGFTYGAIGSLKELDLTDVSQPMDEVKTYLVARYEKRFEIHPRLFEETVASVFRQLGYHARVTSYTGDGGIDVILDGPNKDQIGVQVKRYKNSICVEQIRSLAGALFIGGYTKGVFVTTSRFQSGAQKVCNLASMRGIPIELMDADKFYAALKIGQREPYWFMDDSMAPFYKIPTHQLIMLD
jgi:restriction system protein